jgi:endonuclease/exonuclease/phosphatase family metal-dependent hydrolase
MLADELNRTGSKWDYYVSDKTSGDGSERYAILWKTSAVTYILKPNTSVMSEIGNLMDREPLHATLKVKGKNLNIYSLHLVPTAKNPENEAAVIGSHAALFDKKYSIMSGDFNLGHKKLDKYFETALGLKHNIEGKTSLKTKEKNGEYLAQEYDNIYTGSEINVLDSGIYDFVLQVGDLEEARKLSDHLIAFIVFEMK